ncbi:hypothetical protein CIB84_012805 [Bambusicola thoracicus]|uniref:Uncharacterized protein n=1 Tax=Bambusicola thoracicus TaxID=9083 RepID=A0A2P4SH50_BAMTH|nr:hypothetical protein CIB84_012805 [Bambusicola thoracicus]
MKEAGVAAFTLHPLPPRSTNLFCVQATAKRHFKGSCRATEMFSPVSWGCRSSILSPCCQADRAALCRIPTCFSSAVVKRSTRCGRIGDALGTVGRQPAAGHAVLLLAAVQGQRLACRSPKEGGLSCRLLLSGSAAFHAVLRGSQPCRAAVICAVFLLDRTWPRGKKESGCRCTLAGSRRG